jgi:hypothetical protein
MHIGGHIRSRVRLCFLFCTLSGHHDCVHKRDFSSTKFVELGVNLWKKRAGVRNTEADDCQRRCVPSVEIKCFWRKLFQHFSTFLFAASAESRKKTRIATRAIYSAVFACIENTLPLITEIFGLMKIRTVSGRCTKERHLKGRRTVGLEVEGFS